MDSLPAPPVVVRSQADSEPLRALLARHGSPLLVLDPDIIRQRYQALTAALPGVKLYFAIKANPHPSVLSTLAALGSGFDIATSGEIDLLKAERVSPERCIHTHPIKRDQDIRDALRFGCTTFVVDNLSEIAKFSPYRKRVGLLLRVSFPNPDSPVDLSRKFGCTPEQVVALAEQADALGLHVKGLSFHAGSQCLSPENHQLAIARCAELMLDYNRRHERPFSILDIGGGFPVPYGVDTPTITDFCQPLRAALAALPPHFTVLAEPGRFLVAEAGTAITTVIGTAERPGGPWYYLDDGVYDLFSGRIYDHATYPLEVFSDDAKRLPSTLAGPTCDSIDVVAEQVALPPLEIGDIVVGRVMGAYTNASATDFNLFPRARVVVTESA
ncbi:type III PLP-dependent enzyme [Halioxenophilus sp. WMMB6]|uniref:type III PLP-dependent enzyme n=1 Tax=Halioxenophilus sp. WMMB6 TaxID=3073815 RepID=UPI00295E2982|nr:type III PLP-dependent enzyme [Halioxenophilus sp. WMMB6]